MEEIVGTVAKRRVGIGLHPQGWWSNESRINKRKMVSEEIHHLEEVRHIATAIGQRKPVARTKWESVKHRGVTWGDLKHMEPQKLSFLLKPIYNVLPTPVNFHAWGLTTSERYRVCGKTSNLLDGRTDWLVAIDLEHHFVFPTEIVLMTQRHLVWIKKRFGYCVNGPFWRKFRVGTSA